MRRKRRFHLSGRMRRDFGRAILSAGVVAAIGVALVYAALHPRPRPPAPIQMGAVASDSCAQTLAGWGRIEATLTRATVRAGDLGARCRLLTCPELDCARMQMLRGALISLSSGVKQISVAPGALIEHNESQACGAVISPLAQRLLPGLEQARQALDLCSAGASCVALRQIGAGAEDVGSVLAEIRASADQVESLATALELAESPPPSILLDLARYAAGDAMAVRVDPRANRCLNLGGALAVYPDKGVSALIDPPLAQEPVAPGRQSEMLLEAPQQPGRYLVAILGKSGAGHALGIAPFAIDGPRTGCSGFAGRWETDRGTLVASVRRGVLRATYRRPDAVKPGFLTGAVKGRHFHGIWTSELGAGGAHLVLNAAGDRFLGTAGEKPGQEDGAGLWRGHCAGGRGD